MRKITSVVIALSAILSTSLAMAEEVKLKIVSFLPATTISNSESVPALREKLEELSNGELTLEHYPGGSLGSDGRMQLKLIEDGVADIAEVPLPYAPGRVKGLDVYELPGLSKSNSDGSLMSNELIEKGYISGLEDFVVLGVLQAGPYQLHLKESFDSIKGLRGRKIRVSGAMQAGLVKQLGAVPVANIPANKISENIHRGLLDGALVDMGNVYNFGLDEDAKYHVVNLPLGSFTVIYPMLRKRYESLPANARQAVDAVRSEWFTKVLGQNMDKQAEQVFNRLSADPSHHMIELSDDDLQTMERGFKSMHQRWTKKNETNLGIYQYIQEKK